MKGKASLVEGKESSVLIKMSIPMTIGILSIFFFNLADVYFVAKLGPEPLAALGFCLPIALLLTNINLGIGTGATSIISKLIGEKDNKSCLKQTVAACYVCLGAICLIYTAICIFFLDDLFLLLGASKHTISLIEAYLTPWLLGSILLTLLMLTSAVLRATGDTKTPSMIMLASGVANACLNPLFIFGFAFIPAMGIQGAAYATVLSWAVASFLALRLLHKKEGILSLRALKLNSLYEDVKPILAVGLPAAFSNILVPLSSSILTWLLAKESEVYVAAFGVANRLEPLALVIVISLTATMVPFVGQNWGAGQIHRIRNAMLFAFKFVMGFELSVALVMCLFSKQITALFTKDPIVAESLKSYLYLVPISFGFQGIALLVTSFLNAFQKPLVASAIIIGRLFVFQIPLAFIGLQHMGASGVFLGKSIAGILSGASAWLLYRSLIKKELANVNA